MTDVDEIARRYMAVAWKQMSWAAKKRDEEREEGEAQAEWKASREAAWEKRKAEHPDAFVSRAGVFIDDELLDF